MTSNTRQGYILVLYSLAPTTVLLDGIKAKKSVQEEAAVVDLREEQLQSKMYRIKS